MVVIVVTCHASQRCGQGQVVFCVCPYDFISAERRRHPLRNPWYPCRSPESINERRHGRRGNIALDGQYKRHKRLKVPNTGQSVKAQAHLGVKIQLRDQKGETLSGGLMPALVPYFLNLLTIMHCAPSQWKAGGCMLPVFFYL